MRIAIAGEALIDFTSTGSMTFHGHCGGSPFNTAIAAARLDQPTGFLTQLSADMFGDELLRYLRANGVDTRFITYDAAPSTVAFVERLQGTNRYAFLAEGSADSRYAPRPLPTLPAETVFLQFGSISLLAEPAAGTIAGIVRQHLGEKLIVFDPNIRISLITDLADYRAKFARWLAMTDLLKLSDEDMIQLEPEKSPAACVAEWFQHGVKAIAVTRGATGATLYRQGKPPMKIPAPKVEVVDTIGAGDTFTAAMMVGLLERGVLAQTNLAQLPDDQWRQTLDFAAKAAAINCTRPGANPPRRSEI
jgi:fructokinase